MYKSMFLWIVALVLLCPRIASADASLCNNSGRDIWAIYGEQYTSTDPSKDFSLGWYHIPSGQCATPIIGDVCFWWADVWNNCSDNVLFYAGDAEGNQWGGWGANIDNGTDARWVCSTDRAFDEVPQYNWENPVCPADRVWRFWGAWYYPHPNDDLTIHV